MRPQLLLPSRHFARLVLVGIVVLMLLNYAFVAVVPRSSGDDNSGERGNSKFSSLSSSSSSSSSSFRCNLESFSGRFDYQQLLSGHGREEEEEEEDPSGLQSVCKFPKNSTRSSEHNPYLDEVRNRGNQAVLKFLHTLWETYGAVSVLRSGSALESFRGLPADRDIDLTLLVPPGISVSCFVSFLHNVLAHYPDNLLAKKDGDTDSAAAASRDGLPANQPKRVASLLANALPSVELVEWSPWIYLVYSNMMPAGLRANVLGVDIVVDIDIVSTDMIFQNDDFNSRAAFRHGGLVPREMFSSLCRCTLSPARGQMNTFLLCFTPENMIRYLQIHYGDDFMTPQNKQVRTVSVNEAANFLEERRWVWRTSIGVAVWNFFRDVVSYLATGVW